MSQRSPSKLDGARATSNASAVLPMPPGPVRVTARWAERRSRTRFTASLRPTSSAAIAGTFPCAGGAVVGSARASTHVADAPASRAIQLPSRR